MSLSSVTRSRALAESFFRKGGHNNIVYLKILRASQSLSALKS